MKKFKALTGEQYAAIKKHLHLVNRDFYPEEYLTGLSEDAFPCYHFAPGKLAKKNKDFMEVTMFYSRNPWNCAQMIASEMPEILDYLPETPWYKTAWEKFWRLSVIVIGSIVGTLSLMLVFGEYTDEAVDQVFELFGVSFWLVLIAIKVLCAGAAYFSYVIVSHVAKSL